MAALFGFAPLGAQPLMAALLAIEDLTVEFGAGSHSFRAVEAVSLDVASGEIVALVGESGSGKSVTALAVLRLLPSPPARVASGSIMFEGVDLLRLGADEIRRVRGRQIGMVFQEPMTSLNPVLSIGRQITEGMRLHLGLSARAAWARAVGLLETVGISDAERRLRQYPHHMSGGMRQRIMIAMAVSCEPRLIIADEPTTALDVTIQAQILELLQDLCRRLGVALILITHNLGVVARYADRVNVMYAGRIVEHGAAAPLYRRPAHPYTAGLLKSVPRLDRPRGAHLDPIPGSPPDPSALASGCAFRPRCGYTTRRCAEDVPPLFEAAKGHRTACFHFDRLLEPVLA
jgi:oligopeptide/dipeptide ABC transporter ATP-binding protein